MAQMRLFRDRLTDEDVLAVFTPPDVELTRAQVAKRLGYAKSRMIIAALERLWDEGKLIRAEEVLINRAVVFVYRRA